MNKNIYDIIHLIVYRKYIVVIGVLLFFLGVGGNVFATSNSWGLNGITYISRAQRGADESRRYQARPEYQAILATLSAQATKNLPESDVAKKNKVASEFVMQNFASFFQVDNIIKTENINLLRWNLQYAPKKNKIIVHHTATTSILPTSLEEEKNYMQSVYKYHAFTRGRGDIGYNFLIMPSGRIYEGRAGGAGVIGAHATWNNTDSIGISLVGNFQGNNNPTEGQINSLVQLSAVLMKKYTISPYDYTTYFKSSSQYPYITVMKNYAFASHRDAGTTSCPGENLYNLLPDIRKNISKQMQTIPTQDTTSSTDTNKSQSSKTHTMIPILPVPDSDDDYMGTAPVGENNIKDSSLDTLKANYLDTHVFTPSASTISRLSGAASVYDLAKIKLGLVRVLLYDISLQKKRDVTCSPSCAVRINAISQTTKSFSVSAENGLFTILLPNKTIKTKTFGISTPTNSGTITITNYKRTASNGVELNTFRQGMLFVYGSTKDLQGKISTQPQLINLVSLDNYLRGIAEASDTQPQLKADLLALLTKAYAMYYMGGGIKHPSIPANVLYNAIDDPRFFQKYVGAGWEKVSSKWPLALENTKNTYLVYNNKLPILPYFHCSAGFTWSAKEKRGWKDTPYLQSIKDTVGSCDSRDFEGHGVGLSGKGAAAMIASGSTLQQVINTYYSGVVIVQK